MPRILAAVFIIGLFSVALRAQKREPKWEVEVHAGTVAGYIENGTGALPPAGETYTVPAPYNLTSQRVPSWLFGNGAALFNAAAALHGISPITPLDPFLTSSIVKPQGTMLGFRVSRRLTRTLSLEFSSDHGGQLAISDNALSRLNATVVSSQRAWAPLGSFSWINAQPTDGYNRFHFNTGAIVFHTPKIGRLQPFFVAGLGIMSNVGPLPSAQLISEFSIAQSRDLQYLYLDYSKATTERTMVGVLGAGSKLRITSHFGIRIDVRAFLYSDPITNQLGVGLRDENPFYSLVIPSPPSASTPFFTGFMGPPYSYSTLSGPLSAFPTFAGKGIQSQIHWTIGPYFRF